MKRRQELQIFTMSFLDCISCGFGATVLVFMLMKHSAPVPDAQAHVPQAQISGAEDKLLVDRFEGGHAWSWRVALPTLAKVLKRQGT